MLTRFSRGCYGRVCRTFGIIACGVWRARFVRLERAVLMQLGVSLWETLISLQFALLMATLFYGISLLVGCCMDAARSQWKQLKDERLLYLSKQMGNECGPTKK